jgi:hypothetical protein
MFQLLRRLAGSRRIDIDIIHSFSREKVDALPLAD